MGADSDGRINEGKFGEREGQRGMGENDGGRP